MGGAWPSEAGSSRSHKGAIRIESVPGRGTTFRVLFPAAAGTVRPDGHPHPATAARAGTGTVLVADDEDTVRSLTAHMLEIAGYRILSASNGQEAVEVFAAHRDEIALTLLDIAMPVLGGEEVFRELRRLRPDARILLMSGFDAEEAASDLVRESGASFIQKPFTMGELVEAVQVALDPPPGK